VRVPAPSRTRVHRLSVVARDGDGRTRTARAEFRHCR
jgi:hypothetical protein